MRPTTRPISCFTLRSRSGVPTWPRKYFETTTLVASCDQLFGTSTSVCSNTISPRSLLIFAERSSHSTASKGSSPGRVKQRATLSPRGRRPSFLPLSTARSSTRPPTWPVVSISPPPASFPRSICVSAATAASSCVPCVSDLAQHPRAQRASTRPQRQRTHPARRGAGSHAIDGNDRDLGARPRLGPGDCADSRTDPDTIRSDSGDRSADRSQTPAEPQRNSTGDERGPGTSGAPELDLGPPSRLWLASR